MISQAIRNNKPKGQNYWNALKYLCISGVSFCQLFWCVGCLSDANILNKILLILIVSCLLLTMIRQILLSTMTSVSSIIALISIKFIGDFPTLVLVSIPYTEGQWFEVPSLESLSRCPRHRRAFVIAANVALWLVA